MTKHLMAAILLATIVVACEQPAENDLEAAKAKLSELKTQQKDIEKEIESLEETIAQLDTTQEEITRTLVTIGKAETGEFVYAIQLPGRADSRQNIVVSAESMGNVTRIYVQEGSFVKKGQSIASIDNNIYNSQIAELKTRLELAEQLYEKQKRLWDQKIGSEIQYLQAKNNKESLEQSIKTIQAQAAKSSIIAPINGYLDQVFIREGQTVAMGTPAVRIVDLSKIIVQCDVSEKYIGDLKTKDNIKVRFPSVNKNFETSIKTLGQTVNADNRTFLVEAEIDNGDGAVKPNVLADVTIPTYTNPDAVTVPTSVVQQGKTDDFVYVLKKENGGLIAKKQVVKVGKNYNGQSEILDGLKPGQEIVLLGSRNITDGEPLRVE